MTKKNPDDSVREEQFGANENAAGSEEATAAKETPELNSPPETAETQSKDEEVSEGENEEVIEEESNELSEEVTEELSEEVTEVVD